MKCQNRLVQVNLTGAIAASGEKRCKVVIPGTLPGLNDYVNACRTHRQAGAKLKQETEQVICILIKKQLAGRQFNRAQVAFKWYEPNKRRDKDNIAFAKKFILDSLQTLGTIQGDGWKHVVGFSDEFYIDKANPRIEAIISEVMP